VDLRIATLQAASIEKLRTGGSRVVEKSAMVRLRLAVLALFFSLSAVPLLSQANAQGAVRATFGDWQQRCEMPAGAQAEQCAIVQNVAAEDRPNVTLLVIVLSTADNQSKLLRVVAPLGVLLPAGLGLRIDEEDVGRAGFVRCLATGCVAEVVMDDTLIGQLREGAEATFIVFQTPEEGIGIPVSLDGFGEGFDSLQ
jgi:invasion protein IalB